MKTKTKTRAASLHLVDEYADLERALAPHRANLRRFEELARLLRLAANEAPGNKPVTIRGERHDVTLSIAGMKTIIAPAAVLYETLGRETFLKIASTTVKALEEHVDPLRVAGVTHQEQTGTRTIAIAAKTKTAKAKAA